MKLRPLERAAFFKGHSEKKYRGLIQSASAAFGNAATRLEAFIAAGGAYVYGSYADIDGSSGSRRRNWTRSGAKRSCIASSNSCTTR